MDIVSRLSTFMETHGIGSTQFADACGIPRPTLSQILSGRNKKISDAVIAKIHSAYPRLSVLWLLFGEGSMEISSGGSVEPPVSHTYDDGGSPTYQKPLLTADPVESQEEIGGLFGADPLIFDDEEAENEASKASGQGSQEPVVTIPADGSKSIVNIMVFYSDNSYQSFIPR